MVYDKETNIKNKLQTNGNFTKKLGQKKNQA